jgi:hypothetical protein
MADGTGEQPGDIPQPAGFVLAEHAGRYGHALLPRCPGQGHRVADTRLPGDRGHVDQHAVGDGVGAGVAVDQILFVEHGWNLR